MSQFCSLNTLAPSQVELSFSFERTSAVALAWYGSSNYHADWDKLSGRYGSSFHLMDRVETQKSLGVFQLMFKFELQLNDQSVFDWI